MNEQGIHGQRTLLVVEDDHMYAELISVAMDKAGYGVRVAKTLKDGLCLMDEDITAVTLDLRLPDSQGHEAILAFRQAWKQVPIIILSGYINEHEFHDLVAVGADACVMKPPDLKTLAIAIQRAIKMRDCHGSIDELYRCHRALAFAESLTHV